MSHEHLTVQASWTVCAGKQYTWHHANSDIQYMANVQLKQSHKLFKLVEINVQVTSRDGTI